MDFYKDYSDPDLLSALKAGEEGAFTEIYLRYWKKLLVIAYNHTKDKPASEEILQDILASIWVRRESLNIDCLEAYLATAVKFSVFRFIYNQRKKNQVEVDLIDKECSTISEEQIDARFTIEYIQGIVEKFPEKCRLVFQYSRFKGMSIPEISEEMGIAEKTVEAHLTKGLRLLRLRLRDIGLFYVGFYWL